MERTKRRAVVAVPVWVWGLVAVGVLLCGGFVVAVGAAVVLGGTKPAAVQPKRYTREEFKQLVVGKDEASVLTLLGKPARTSQYSTGNSYWVYENVTFDTINGKPDSMVFIDFDRQKIATGTHN